MGIELLPNGVQYFQLSSDLKNVVSQFVGFWVNLAPGYYGVIFVFFMAMVIIGVFRMMSGSIREM